MPVLLQILPPRLGIFSILVNRNNTDLMGNPSKKTGNPSHEFGLPQALKRGELKRKGTRLRKIGRCFCKGWKKKLFEQRTFEGFFCTLSAVSWYVKWPTPAHELMVMFFFKFWFNSKYILIIAPDCLICENPTYCCKIDVYSSWWDEIGVFYVLGNYHFQVFIIFMEYIEYT